MDSSAVITTIIGVVVGAGGAYFFLQDRIRSERLAVAAQFEPELKSLKENLSARDSEVATLRNETKALTDKNAELSANCARFEEKAESLTREMKEALTRSEEAHKTQLDEIKRSHDEKTETLKNSYRQQLDIQSEHFNKQKELMDDRLREAFATLSTKALSDVQKQFLELANQNFGIHSKEAKGDLDQRKQAIEEMLKPLRENVEKLEKFGHELETKREVAYNNIEKHVQNMVEASVGLANAMKKPTVRGSWGEMGLMTVVESFGLVEGVDYERQDTTHTEDGMLRADMVIKLTRGRKIVIDAKTPMDSFHAGVNCEDADQRTSHFKAHAKRVRDHVMQLSQKKYWAQYPGLDKVILYLNSEAMFLTAIEHDPALIQDARKAGIFIANPSTLLAMLSAVAYILDQERLNESAAKISDIGQKLYNGMGTYATHVGKVGRNLRLSVDAYNDSIKSLERSVLSRTRQLKELGVGGDEIEEIDEISSLPIGFQSQELLAGSKPEEETDLLSESANDLYGSQI